jgi:predicted outer membrane repeat protein
MFRSIFNRLSQSQRRASKPTRKPSRLRLRIEPLEDRLTPSTFTVTNLNPSGLGSLPFEVNQANLAGQGVVNFASGLNGTIGLNSEIAITSNLRIDTSVATGGTGPHSITIAAPHSGGRDFDIIGGVHVSFIGDSVTPPTFIIQGGSNVLDGGAIVAFSPQSSITLVGIDVRNNSATGSGGGIFTLGSLGIYNSVVESNTALFNGGGIFVGKTFGAYNSDIHDNATTGGDGGGVYEFGTGSTMIFSNTVVQDNHAIGGAGGGAWAQYNLTSKGSTFTQNTATRNGGAIFSNNGNVYLLSLPGTSSSSSSATVVSNNSAGADGGGVWADHTLYSDGASILDNTALGGGGGLYSLFGPVVAIDASLVQGNQAFGTSMISAAPGLGGGIFTDGDVFVLTSSTIGGNIADADGGGIYSLKTVHIADSIVDGNIAGGEPGSVAGNGGGVFAVQQIFVIDGVITFNQALNGDGGGLADQRGNIYVTSLRAMSTDTPIPPTNGSSISDNQAIDGGGIWDVVGTIIITEETLISHNVASLDGGGIFVGTFGSLRVDTSTVSSNQAVSGGGIAAEGPLEVTIFQSRVIFNKATAPPGADAGGGMIAANVPNLSITYSTFASNAATSGNGGALALVAVTGFPGGANAGLDDDTFGGFTNAGTGVTTPNSAGGLGGAIYVRNVEVDIIHLTFNDNVAFGGTGVSAGHAGSDIFADVGSAVTFEDTLFDDTNNFANPLLNPGSSELLDTAFSGGLLSAGYNLVHDGSWVNVTNWNPLNGDIANGHQDLGPLQFNQAVPPGPTFTETYRLVTGAGEQAVGGGDDVGPQLDQNGRLRPVGLPSDIGSTQAF